MHESPYLSEGLGGIRELSTSASLKAAKLQQPAPFLGEGEASEVIPAASPAAFPVSEGVWAAGRRWHAPGEGRLWDRGELTCVRA